MVTETVETPVQTDQEPVETTQTETPATEVVAEGAAEESTEAAAVTQVEVTPAEKPEFITRADWEAQLKVERERAATDALELDRKRRQTENGRKAQQEKRDTEDLADLIDTAKAAFGAAGVFEIPEEPIVKAVDRMVRKRTEQIATGALDAVAPVLEYLGGTTDDLSDEYTAAARHLRPAVQAFVDRARTLIETNARKGYIAESELPARVKAGVDAALAARAATGREGQEELKRVEGTPAPSSNTLASWETRVAHQGEDGYPVFSDADWRTYRQIRKDNGL